MGPPEKMLDTLLGNAVFCAVDVETSGLRMESRLVEIGAVRFDLYGKRSELQCVVNPREPIPPVATDIHGITDEMVRGAPFAPDVLPGLLNIMKGCLFIAHNATFDVKVINGELARAGIDPPHTPVLCTISLARRRIPGPPNYRLSTLVEFLQIETYALHNALSDATAAMEVFLAAVEGLPHETPVGELPGLLGWFDAVAPSTVADVQTPYDVSGLEAAADQRLAIEMEYTTRSGPVPVVVTPLYFFNRNGYRLMRAYCHRDGTPKDYRLDRVLYYRRV